MKGRITNGCHAVQAKTTRRAQPDDACRRVRWLPEDARREYLLGVQRRNIGRQGLDTSCMGLGCMGMTHAYGTRDDEESVATLRHALDRGVTFLDTAEVYGPYSNESLVGRAIQGRRSGLTIATKFGISIGPDGRMATDGSPGRAREAVEGSLQRLGVDVIDL